MINYPDFTITWLIDGLGNAEGLWHNRFNQPEKPWTMTDPQPAYPIDARQPGLHLVYAAADLPIADIRIPKWAAPDTLSLEWKQLDPLRCLGKISLDEHTLLVAGLAAPLPLEVIDRTIMVSPWGAQIKAAMRQHRVHLSLLYGGGHPDPIEQMVALYKTALLFVNEDLLGIVNANAWTAHPPADYVSLENIDRFRREIPFSLWFGYVRFYTDHEAYWLVTKGHHIFDVPDLAYFVQPGEDADAIINLFINLFYYLYEEDVEVIAGDTLALQGVRDKLVFKEVPELTEDLMGPAGTLVIARETSTD